MYMCVYIYIYVYVYVYVYIYTHTHTSTQTRNITHSSSFQSNLIAAPRSMGAAPVARLFDIPPGWTTSDVRYARMLRTHMFIALL